MKKAIGLFSIVLCFSLIVVIPSDSQVTEPIPIWGNATKLIDTTNEEFGVAHTEGVLQAIINSSALPSGASTEDKQDDSIDQLVLAVTGLTNLLTELQLKADLTETQPVSLITGFSTSAKQLADNHNVTVSNMIAAVETGLATSANQTSGDMIAIAIPQGWAIAEGEFVGSQGFRQLGYNLAMQNGVLEDITELSANVVVPTTPIQAWVDCLGAADDGSPALYDTTATGGTSTTLIDTNQTFSDDGTAAVGDMILLDDDIAFGIITEITDNNTLTCADGFTGDKTLITPEIGDNYRVVDKSLNTGALVLEVHGLDSNYAEQSEFVIPNGTAAVQLSKSYIRFNNFHVMLAGSGEVASNTIYVQAAAVSAVFYISVSAGGNMSEQAFFTVPAGKTAYITDWSASATGTKSARMELSAKADLHGRALVPTFHFQDVMIVKSGGRHVIFPIPLQCPAKCDIKVSGEGIGGVTEGSASFGFWIE